MLLPVVIREVTYSLAIILKEVLFVQQQDNYLGKIGLFSVTRVDQMKAIWQLGFKVESLLHPSTKEYGGDSNVQ